MKVLKPGIRGITNEQYGFMMIGAATMELTVADQAVWPGMLTRSPPKNSKDYESVSRHLDFL